MKVMVEVIGVRMKPGQIVETLIPRPRTWTRSASMYEFTAALLAQ